MEFELPSAKNLTRRASSLLLGLFARQQSESETANPPTPPLPQHQLPLRQSSSLRGDLLSLLETAKDADVSVVVGSDRVAFRAHRLILSTRSDFFKDKFITAMAHPNQKNKQLVVELPQIDPDAFRILLRYIYSAEEDDEATHLCTQDWRLVLACFEGALQLELHLRATTYQRVFTHIFSSSDISRESAREMWLAACGSSGAETLLISCAPAFWLLFGSSGSTFAEGLGIAGVEAGLGVGGRQLLSGLELGTLVNVVNAIPEHLESALGKFRLIKSWIQLRPCGEIALPEDDERCVNKFGTGKQHARGGSLSPPPLSSPSSRSWHEGEDVDSPPTTPTQSTNQPMLSPKSPSAVTKTLRSYESFYNLQKIKPRESFHNLGSFNPVSDSSLPALGSRENKVKARESLSSINTTSRSIVNRESYSSLKTLIPRKQSTIFHQHHLQPASPSTPSAIPQSYRNSLQHLHLSGLTASDILREIEPAGILTSDHILQLYRAAAAAPQVGVAWGPVPLGFQGRKCSTVNSRTRWVTVGGGGNAVSAGNITYCTPEAVGGGGKFRWTVIPVHLGGGVSVGVSADVLGTSGIVGGASGLFAGGGRGRRGSSGEEAGANLARFIGDDGGWSLSSDGSLHVGRIFVGRLPNGLGFARGTRITVTLDLDARTLGFMVGNVDCGVSFRNLPTAGGSLYPSVRVEGGAEIAVSPVKRVF
ncbi:hypothetical protein HDU98_008860 [Podochytrium sp. JEL0797]|nr:hypothetical protein HDU98_008860 [Podochytrium sp. JEL0797]